MLYYLGHCHTPSWGLPLTGGFTRGTSHVVNILAYRVFSFQRPRDVSRWGRGKDGTLGRASSLQSVDRRQF